MERGPQSRRPARAGVFDLLKLGARMGAGALRGKNADPGATFTHWAEQTMRRDGASDLELAIPGMPLELVGDRAHSADVLDDRPGLDGHEAGTPKAEAMAFLAPGALTVANRDAWLTLRPFNEQVLGKGNLHPFAQTQLRHVRAAFARPVRSANDIRAAMGRAMVPIVLGATDQGEDPADDVSVLFDVVGSPVKRKILGFLYRKRRDRLFALLGKKWDAAATVGQDEQTLIARARQLAPEASRDTLLDQIPHWMFTFTRSGSDLLTRTMCLVTSRPTALAHVLDEIHGAGPPDRAESVGRLAYLEACLLETGRLFPPVTKSFHKTTEGGGGKPRELLHYFPLLQRDDRLGATVHEFHPERWLARELDPPAAASNLFLRGPRACPGMNIILFVCKAAIAQQLGELGLLARQERLTHDPLPISFPKLETPFTISRYGASQ